MASTLEMIFKTAEGRNHRLTLNDPKADLTGAEVKAAMDLIVSNDVFSVGGGLVEVVSAAIITTDKTPLELS